MEMNIERDCNALGGLFQQIISDMKNGTPVWEDFLAKATKLHSCLRATVQAISAYLDSFQKIADAATNARGATKEIGSALTRICLRHKAVEARMKTFTSAIMDCLILPLQEKMEDWKKTLVNLDKEHSKEYKKARAELKKRSTDTLRLQKKAKKGKNGELQRRVESCLQDVSEKRYFLEEAEKKALRAALIEERSRFCVFIGCFRPVVSEEIAILSELTHIQEMADHLDKISSDPNVLPPSSEQVIQDLKGSDSLWSFQTPPSSPSSLGSRKSSMCSISSLNSSSSGSSKSHNSPNHYWQRSASQNGPLSSGALPRLSSISSQDSGFRSQDVLFLKNSSAMQILNICEQTDNNNSSNNSHQTEAAGAPSNTSTWPNFQETLQFERAASAILKERPHTISSAYERGHQRPSLTVYTFHAPEISLSQPASPVSVSTAVSESNSTLSPLVLSNSSTPNVSPQMQTIYSRPPIPQRCSSLERPFVPSKSVISKNQNKTDAMKTVLSKVQTRLPSDLHQPPMYVNMCELVCLAASKAQEINTNLPPPPPPPPPALPSEPAGSTPGKAEPAETGDASEKLLEISSGYGIQNNYAVDEHLNEGSFGENNTFRNTLLRKGSIVGQKPPPPIRRTASISSTSKQSHVGNIDSSGSPENLPPPPSFLLESGATNESAQSCSIVKDVQNLLQTVSLRNSSPSPSFASNSTPSTVRVSETVRTLTELKHTPASPNAVRRSLAVNRSQSAERRETVGTGLIAALSAKIAPNMSPRHCRRHSEDITSKDLPHGRLSPLGNRFLQRGISSPGQNFLESLNAKLALQQQIQQNQLKIHNATRVRQLFAGKTVSDPSICHDSLMEQIKKGTSLKKTRTINDRSAPKIH